ncbi:MAG: hypothetical protein J1F64_01275 [Oscillospiraceae bacterium]|nr:hypothetical protein [Oscillospiraceae bacterium]
MKNKYEYLNDVKTDFSQYEEIKLTEQECINMKKNLKNRINGEKNTGKSNLKRYIIPAACIAAVAVVCQSAFAQGFITNIIKSVTTGHNNFMQIEMPDLPDKVDVPAELAGQIYDSDGNSLAEIDRNTEKLYDKDGNEIYIATTVEDGKTKYSTKKELKPDEIPESDKSQAIYTSLDEYRSVLSFDLKVPELIPDGYSFLYATGYRSSNGDVSGDYAALYYTNGKEKFSIHERIINEETAFETGTSLNLKEIDVNGCKAAYDGTMISWETDDDVSVSIMSGGSSVKGDILIDMARSTK